MSSSDDNALHAALMFYIAELANNENKSDSAIKRKIESLTRMAFRDV